MTHRIQSICFTLFAAAALTATSAIASETRVAVLHVPFAFTAGQTDMPAGDYSISKTEQRILFLRTAGKTVALLPVGSTAASPLGSNSTLRFERVGGRAVLTEVLVDGAEGYLMRK
jgi:hypothetical protein